jgi:hypothetical protein
MNYPVTTIGGEAQHTTNNDDDQQTFGTTFDWGYGDHSTADSESMTQLSGAIRETMQDLDDDVDDEMLAVLEDANELVGAIDVEDYECSHPDCGLSHGHGPDKHDIRNDVDCAGVEGFNITDEFAEMMEFVPNCHCGANEAAMLMPFFGYMNTPMFNDQEEFEGVMEMDPEVVDEIYRVHNEEHISVSMAAGKVAARRGVPESEIAPLGLRDEMEAFFQRRRHVESGGNAAPIGEQTRSVIEENREELEEVTSE